LPNDGIDARLDDMQVQIDARLDDMQAQILAKVSFFEVNIECYSFKTFFIF
jgi:hypothetical protein